jgi:hypothetical protein
MNYQPLPQLGDRVINIGIPQRCLDQWRFEQDLEPVAHDCSFLWTPDATHNWYQIPDTESARRLMTDMILRYQDLRVETGANTTDWNLFESGN